MTLAAIVSRGTNKGKILYPQLYSDGSFVVSPDRFERNHVRVKTVEEIEKYLAEGMSLRMSNPEAGIQAASLIGPGSVRR
jgi:hypothetical protein